MSPIPISRTKIILPRRRAELLTRKRLVDFLFDSLDRKLILVSAPAGYGKTSLLIDFASQSELKCCWLSLDEMDREPQRFMAYFIAAISEVFPKFGNQSAHALDNLTSFDQDMERVLVTLVNEMYEQIQEHFILFLDDFHLVENVPPIQVFLNRFTQLMDENCHIIVASRVLTSLPDLSLMVAREQVNGLSFADLAFHADEIQALLAQNEHRRISDEEARKMIETSEGWITGLQFFGNGASSGGLVKPVPGIGVELSDYLGRQVLDRQPPALREFILRTSMLGEFDTSLCEAVLSPFYEEPQDWQGLINAVVQNNVFVLPVGADGRWLRYHHLFRDFLRKRFEQTHPQEVRPILSRLGLAYEDLAEWEKAHYIYKQLNDSDVLAGMIERASSFMLQHALVTLESWLNELAPSMLRTRPGLLSIRGAIMFTKGNTHEGLALLDQAEQTLRASGNIPGLALTLVRRGSALRSLGNYDVSQRDADEAIALTEFRDDLQLLYAESLRVKGLALYRLGQARQAIEFLENSLNLHVRLNDTSSIPILYMETGMAYQTVGNYTEADVAYEKALQIWNREGNLSWQANILNNLAILRQSLGVYEKASLAFEEGLVCAQRSGHARMESIIAAGLGDLYAELEDFDIAWDNYQHGQEIAQRIDDRFLLLYLVIAQAGLALLQKNPAEALRLLAQYEDETIRHSDSLYEKGLKKLILGRCSLLNGNLPQAIHELEEAGLCFAEDGRKLEGDTCRIWLAAAHRKAGNKDMAAKIIKPLFEGGRSQISHPIVVAAHQAREWLDGLQSHAEVGRAVGDLFTRASRFAEKLPATRRQLHRMARVVQVPHSRLIIQTFGPASVNVGGKSLTLSDWQTQTARDLFFFFLTSQKPHNREQVEEIFWPDVDEPKTLHLRFKNEMYRLRRAVGQEVILFEDASYRFNRSLDFEYDVESFESFLSRARSTADPAEQIEYYQKAIDLVRGPFLADIYADWVISERARLGKAYLSTLNALGDLFLEQSQLEQALSVCQRALDYELAFEPAYVLSMRIHHRLGDRASVIRVYQTCDEVMRREVGLPPSRETQELYKRLIS